MGRSAALLAAIGLGCALVPCPTSLEVRYDHSVGRSKGPEVGKKASRKVERSRWSEDAAGASLYFDLGVHPDECLAWNDGRAYEDEE